jgi:hypothetical protein
MPLTYPFLASWAVSDTADDTDVLLPLGDSKHSLE